MFWRGKRVFITGHTGFKGSWLSLWLQSKGAHVTGFALAAPTNPSMFELAHVADQMTSIEGDVRDFAALKSAIATTQPEIVFHLAAQSLVRPSYADPIATYATNVMGTVNVLEAVRQITGISAVLVVTSDKCYENREWVWGYRESEPMGGYDPYSSSKGCAELVTSAFRSSFFSLSQHKTHGIALGSARAGNVIGGGDWAKDRLIPDIMRAFLKGDAAIIRNPNAIRPWQHVLEPLHGYLILAEKLYLGDTRFAEAWNFGPNEGDTRPVSWIIERAAQIWGSGATYIIDSGREHLHEAGLLKLDSSKAKGRLEWHSRLSLEQSLERTVNWYKAYLEVRDMRDITMTQIKVYEDEVSVRTPAAAGSY